MLRFERVKIVLVISFAMGLIYALTNQFINRIVLVNVPLYAAIGSPLLSIIGITCLIAIWGTITAIPQKVVYKLVLGSFSGALGAGVLVLIVRDVRLGFLDSLAIFLTRFIAALPLFLMMAYFLHWSVQRLMTEYFSAKRLSPNRALPIMITLLMAAVIGGFGLISAEGRGDLRLVDAYLVEGASSKTISSLPLALRNVPGYLSHAKVTYTLEPTTDIDLFTGEAPEGTLQREKGIVIVRFNDGFRMTCLTIDESVEIVCEKAVSR